MSKSIQLKNKDNEKMYPHPYYPIGSIYLSVNDTNPSNWFGGTWEQISKGRTLVGVDTSDTDFNTVKKTGGSKSLQKHKHDIINLKSATTFSTAGTGHAPSQTSGTRSWKTIENTDITTSEIGTGNSGNLQPYFTCYIWCRIA